MKKLIYNENTKEIDVVEKEHMPEKDEKKPRKDKKWLEENKIFLDIFSTFCVGVMGLIISIVGWKTNQRSADIYQRQLEILDNDREPYFTIHCETVEKLFENDSYAKKMYIIRNEGGRINGASIFWVRGYIGILLREPVTGEKKNYEIYVPGMFRCSDGLMSLYDEENKLFYFYECEGDKYNNFINELRLKLEEMFTEYLIIVTYSKYVNIIYSNYKNEAYDRQYLFSESEMSLFTEDAENKITRLGIVTKIDDVKSLAKSIYDLIMEEERKQNENPFWGQNTEVYKSGHN